ncbi:MFS transporter [Promicromonospora sp. NPDC052451]|uniref:MFS transporter n=1 Tax=Promicromonospora sp. NPDC052451 TaxID=3364407 RepID=UPI0037C5C609
MTAPAASRPPARRPTPDHRIVRAIWPAMLAGTVSLLPFTVYSTFLVPISETVRADAAAVGALRGLGGVAALLTGVAIAPLLGRWPRHRAVAGALALLALCCLTATTGSYAALVAFCLGTGVATAALTPALLALATSRFTDPADGGRAATLVSTSTTLAAVLAGPVVGGLAAWRGWAGALWVTAALAVLTGLAFLRSADPGAEQAAAPGYRESLRRLRSRPDLLAVVAVAGLRTTSFMGYLSFLAVTYHDRFGTDAGTFTLVWTLSGASFVVGGYLAGRWARDDGAAGPARPRLLLLAGLGGGLVAVLTVFLVPWLPGALAATTVMGFGHAVVGATATSLIAQRAGRLTPATFGLQAAGMSLGVFAGAALGGAGLAVAGSPGLAVALAVPTALAVLLVRSATRTRIS